MQTQLVSLFYNKFGTIATAALYPGDTTVSRSGPGDVTVTRTGPGDTITARTGPGSATVGRKTT